MDIRLKRIFEPTAADDGFRILVDRLWPRGVSKERAALDLWLKEIAPSHELRRWYGHDPGKWTEFRRRYAKELEDRADELRTLRGYLDRGRVTLLYGAVDEIRNQAVALREYLES